MRATGNVRRLQPFATPSGWTVELDEAWAAVGPIYLYGEPPASGALAWLEGFLGVRPALAHVAVQALPVVGEALLQLPVDLLATDSASFGASAALVGQCTRAEWAIYPPRSIAHAGDDAAWDALGERVVLVRGTARRPALQREDAVEEIRFSVGLSPGDLIPAITEIEAPVELAPGGTTTVALEADVAAWLASVDFSTAGPADAEGTRALERDTQGWAAFRHGVQSRASYHVHEVD